MFNTEDIITLKRLLSEAFPELDNAKRDEMLKKLIDTYPNGTPFYTMNGLHIARIGVRYTVNEYSKGSFYYATDYDTEFLY